MAREMRGGEWFYASSVAAAGILTTVAVGLL